MTLQTTAKERIQLYLDYKRIMQRKFYEKNNLSHAYLGQPGSVTSDKLATIITNYPDLSPEWVITGVGEMLRGEAERAVSSVPYLILEDKLKEALKEAEEWKNKYFEALANHYRHLQNPGK